MNTMSRAAGIVPSIYVDNLNDALCIDKATTAEESADIGQA